MNPWPAIYRVACIACLVLLCVGGVCAFLPKCNQLRELQRRKAQVAEENRHTAALARELREKEERFHTDPAFVERVAKETGMIKPEEVVFKFTDDRQTAAPHR
jgi:cell division protein FtsB